MSISNLGAPPDLQSMLGGRAAKNQSNSQFFGNNQFEKRAFSQLNYQSAVDSVFKKPLMPSWNNTQNNVMQSLLSNKHANSKRMNTTVSQLSKGRQNSKDANDEKRFELPKI